MKNYLFVLVCAVLACAVAFDSVAQPSNGRLVEICHFPPGNPENPQPITVDENAVESHLEHGDRLGACFVVDAATDRSYGTIDTIFRFSARVFPDDVGEIAEFLWEIEDGRTFSGPQISLSFDEPGFHAVTLTATSVAGDVDTAEVGVVVHENGQLAPDALAIPEPFGDVNGDGDVTLTDVHLAAKFVGRLAPLPDERARLAADMDFSDRITFDDVELIAETVLSEQTLPDRLLASSGAPGSLVTLISHHLLDPEDFIEISIGESDQRQVVTRPILGYTTFIMPFTGVAAEPGEQEIRLLANGSEVSSYTFTITAPGPIPEEPASELNAFLDELQALLAVNESLIAEQADNVGLAEDEREILLAAARGGMAEFEEISAELEGLLSSSEGEALAAVFFEAANANGLPELRAQMQDFLQAAEKESLESFTLASVSPDAVCDEILPALCALQQSADLVGQASGLIGATCDITLAAGLGGTITGVFTKPSAAALVAWAKFCAPLEFALDTASIITDLISDVDQDLRTEVENRAPEPGEVATITATLEVIGLKDICTSGSRVGTERLVKELGEKVVERMVERKLTVRAVTRVFTFLGEDLVKRFFDLLQKGAEEVITSTGVDQAILDFAAPYCDLLRFGPELVMNASRVMSGPQPDVGTLTFQPDGTAEYACPEDSESVPDEGVRFDIEKQICESVQSRTETVQCVDLRDVTITMGDNGSLNDDIFEALLDGVSVLTSSVPVRSTSVTVQLPADSTAQVQMLGRAAPDGIGTYFISFSGATVIAGDATSGTDLVPGTVKNFTIQVQE